MGILDTYNSFFLAYPVAFLSWVFLLGLCLGSFINVVCIRAPIAMERLWFQSALEFLGEFRPSVLNKSRTFVDDDGVTSCRDTVGDGELPGDIVSRSQCPGCGHRIRWFDNVPLLSFLVLRGKCRDCATKISAQYPLVELIAGVATVYSVWAFGVSSTALFSIVFFALAICMSVVDLRHMYLPDSLVYTLLWAGLLGSAFSVSGFPPLEEAVLAVAIAWSALSLFVYLFKKARHKEGMGGGDLKLFAALAAWCGLAGSVSVIIIASLIGLVMGVLYLLVMSKDSQSRFPFGPALLAAGLMVWVSQGKFTNVVMLFFGL